MKEIAFTVDQSKRSVTASPILAAGETANITVTGITAADIDTDTVKIYVFDESDNLIATSTALAGQMLTATLNTETAEVVTAFASCVTPSADKRIFARILIEGGDVVYANSAIEMVNNLQMSPQPTPAGTTWLSTALYAGVTDLGATPTFDEMVTAIKELMEVSKTGVLA